MTWTATPRLWAPTNALARIADWKALLESALSEEELKPAEPGMLAKLEELDVLVFEAVAGKSEALTRFPELWPKVRGALDRRLLSESLEQ